MSASKVRHCWFAQKQLLSSIRTMNFQARYYQWKSGAFGNLFKNPMNHPQPRLNENITDELYQFLCAYRVHGHKKAVINPVSTSHPSAVPELDIKRFSSDVEKILSSNNFLGNNKFKGTILEAEKQLTEVYSSKVGVEFMHLEEETERIWFQNRWEELFSEEISPSVRKDIAKELLRSQVFDRFLAIKYVSLKRYGSEGAEAQMAFFLELFRLAAEEDVQEIVVGAHHRGRLNVIVNLLKMPPDLLFRKLSGKSEFPPECNSIGDVISHLCPSARLKIEDRELHIQMSNLPSHLEAVCPVSLGQTRAIQQTLGDCYYSSQDTSESQVLNVQVHGDGAFMGQGVSHESLLLSVLPHYNVGGSVHLIINNQLGFTTPPDHGRGTRYASDLAKFIAAPIIHVNGEYPEDVVRATKIACEYRRKFCKNAFIDLNCYRRWGHNELDDPTFTNPLLYKIINNKTTVPDTYASRLINEGVMTEKEVEDIKNEHYSFLSAALENAPNFVPPFPERGLWENFSSAPNAITTWDTGVIKDLLKTVGLRSVHFPDDFNVHANIAKNHIKSRVQKMESGANIDWGTAEALALGSLLYEGYNVRISGQEVGRGTFSQRHIMFVDQNTDEVHVPLNNISEQQIGQLEIVNSPLSEEAVLGFEYGFSTITPNTLVIWEAQFGDFFNGAQIQIDTYITSGEAKWMTMSGLTMLLPHGFDGAGAEHSSCRVERFLQLSDSSETHPDGENVNIIVANPTTPAQYFHLLRRQMIRNYRKPLIVVAPKILLRHPDAVSTFDDLSPGSMFQPVLGDNCVEDPSKVTRLIFTSGKHYYALKKFQNEQNITNVAIIRVEELSPFPTHQLRTEIAKYKRAKEFIWSQEEPRNMGGWSFCHPRFQNLVGCKVRYAGRNSAPCPDVGIGELYKIDAQMVIKSPFK